MNKDKLTLWEKITTKTDIVDYLLTIFLFFFLWFCIDIAYQLKRHHDTSIIKRQLAWPETAIWTGPDIEQCDKELWLRIKDGCGENSNE